MPAQFKNKRGLNGIYLNQEKLKSDHKSEFGFHTAKQDDVFIYFTNEIKTHKLHQNHNGWYIKKKNQMDSALLDCFIYLMTRLFLTMCYHQGVCSRKILH